MNMKINLLATLFLVWLVSAATVSAQLGGATGECVDSAGSSLEFNYRKAESQGQTPEQYIEELIQKARQNPYTRCSGPCSQFAEVNIYNSITGDSGRSILPGRSPSGGRAVEEVAASMRANGRALSLNGMRIEELAIDLEGLTTEQIIAAWRGGYVAQLRRQFPHVLERVPPFQFRLLEDRLLNAATRFNYQATLINKMLEGEVMYFSFEWLTGERHAINILRAEGKFLWFDESGLIRTTDGAGVGALLGLSQNISPRYGGKEINWFGRMNSIRIVN